MDKDALVNEFKIFLVDFFKTSNLDLIELIHRRQGRDLFLSILVDKPEGGITLGECAQLNRKLREILDEKNILQESYILEVSSPGLDRPLKTENDFKRSLNRRVKLFLSELVNGKLEWEGLISKVSEGRVYVDTGLTIVEIPLEKINKAKQII